MIDEDAPQCPSPSTPELQQEAPAEQADPDAPMFSEPEMEPIIKSEDGE